jgi:hypothetical protein
MPMDRVDILTRAEPMSAVCGRSKQFLDHGQVLGIEAKHRLIPRVNDGRERSADIGARQKDEGRGRVFQIWDQNPFRFAVQPNTLDENIL